MALSQIWPSSSFILWKVRFFLIYYICMQACEFKKKCAFLVKYKADSVCMVVVVVGGWGSMTYLPPHWSLLTLCWTDIHFLQILQAGVKLETESSPHTVWSIWKKNREISVWDKKLCQGNHYTTAHHKTSEEKTNKLKSFSWHWLNP